jgi:hypothetical protein
MNKPITVIYEDFKQGLASLINDSGLPAFMIEPILRDYLEEVRRVASQQYRQALAPNFRSAFLCCFNDYLGPVFADIYAIHI